MKKNNKLIVESDSGKEIFEILIKVETNDEVYIIYTKNELNKYGDTIAYAASYEFVDGKQILKPVINDSILEFLDSILVQIESKMNKESEVYEKE